MLAVYYTKIWIKDFIKRGRKIGSNTNFTDLRNSKIDSTRPWLIEIDNYCIISMGVTIYYHMTIVCLQLEECTGNGM